MSRFSRCLAFLGFLQTILAIAHAQTATVIPANEAAAHLDEWATVEGVVAKVFNTKIWEHISEHRSDLSKPDLYQLDIGSIAVCAIN
jgi:hypothetical protein